MWRGGVVLLPRLERLLDDECATSVVTGLLFGLLDDLDFHDLILCSFETGWEIRSAQVLDGDVDQPGAQRSGFLVRFLAFVLHGLSP